MSEHEIDPRITIDASGAGMVMIHLAPGTYANGEVTKAMAKARAEHPGRGIHVRGESSEHVLVEGGIRLPRG